MTALYVANMYASVKPLLLTWSNQAIHDTIFVQERRDARVFIRGTTRMKGANSAQIADVRWHCIPRFTSKPTAFPSVSKWVQNPNFEAN